MSIKTFPQLRLSIKTAATSYGKEPAKAEQNIIRKEAQQQDTQKEAQQQDIQKAAQQQVQKAQGYIQNIIQEAHDDAAIIQAEANKHLLEKYATTQREEGQPPPPSLPPPPLPPQAEVPVAPCADTNFDHDKDYYDPDYNMPESKVMQNPNVMKHKFIPEADNPAELKLRKILDKKNAREKQRQQRKALSVASSKASTSKAATSKASSTVMAFSSVPKASASSPAMASEWQ